MALHPKVLWAQTTDAVTLTVVLQGMIDFNIDLKENSLSFTGVKDNDKYAFDIQFYKPINTETSKYATYRNLEFKLYKAESERWPRVDSRGSLHWLQCDWSKWVDTDDEGEMDMEMPHGFGADNYLDGGDYDDTDDDDKLEDLNIPEGEDDDEDLEEEESADDISGSHSKEGKAGGLEESEDLLEKNEEKATD